MSENNEGFKGFLHLQCASCGNTHTFCAKHPVTHYSCGVCGERTRLENMVRMEMVCECGNRSVYMTNTQEDLFDASCIRCGAPVAMAWNEGLWKFICCDKFDNRPKKKRRRRR